MGEDQLSRMSGGLGERYPYIVYEFNTEEGYAKELWITIWDEQIPQCIPYDTQYDQSFGSYQLKIVKNEEKNWLVYAQRDGLVYEIMGENISKDEFYAFL